MIYKVLFNYRFRMIKHELLPFFVFSLAFCNLYRGGCAISVREKCQSWKVNNLRESVMAS